MIPLLRAILSALERMLVGQQEAEDQLRTVKTDLDGQLASQAAAIEHLRELIETDAIPTGVSAPTFIPTGGTA